MRYANASVVRAVNASLLHSPRTLPTTSMKIPPNIIWSAADPSDVARRDVAARVGRSDRPAGAGELQREDAEEKLPPAGAADGDVRPDEQHDAGETDDQSESTVAACNCRPPVTSASMLTIQNGFVPMSTAVSPLGTNCSPQTTPPLPKHAA